MSVLRWLVVIELLGVASWPLCFLLFRNFPDGGLGVARLLGLLIISYVAWLAASLSLFPFDGASLASFLILFLVCSSIFCTLKGKEMLAFLKERKRILLFEQILFLSLYFIAVFIQSYKPDITLAEKEADMMYLQAVLNGRSMPPQDLWFAGGPVNYYYFGYVVVASMVKLAAVRPEIGFNLAVASVVPLACCGAFSLAYNLTRRRGVALLAPLFLIGLGNFDALRRAIRAGGLAGTDWWYTMFAHGSREVIPGTIHEFPCFSFLLGDLHPHFIFMPFSFLVLSMIFVLFTRHGDLFPQFSFAGWRLYTIVCALVLGSVFMFNTWDYPTYVLFLALTAVVLAFRYSSLAKSRSFFGWLLALVVLSVVLFLPFRLQFAPAARPHVGLVDAAKRSSLGAFLTVNGLACFAIVSCLVAGLVRCSAAKALKLNGWPLVFLGMGVVVVGGALTGCAVVGIMSAVCLLAAMSVFSRCEWPIEKLFVTLLLLFCAALFLGCELFYLKDFYSERLQRQNTVFKYYFQAWILSSIIFAAGFLFVSERLKGVAKIAWQSALVVLVAGSLIYPVWGTYHRCQRFRSGALSPAPYVPTLDGSAYVKKRHPGEYNALQWVKENIPADNVILEATGAPYSFHGRVSTFTGRPTVLGWGNQESLWRDWSWKIIMARIDDIKRMYDETRKENIKPLLRKYGIRYVYVGTLEEKKYNAAGLRAFAGRFPVVYARDDVRIYRVGEE
jgi:YYY domain-containing protein